MNAWLLAALLLLPLGLGPCVWVACRGSAPQRLAGANLATVMTTVLFLLLAQGFSRSSYVDLALVLAVLGPAGTLVFTRLLSPARESRTSSPNGGNTA
ncbi:MrpF/PhaF family protein [Streptacidiphilus jiangxiensis]|uniref:Multisubunit Na+/H+ antiporter, MnhF subunit n=1 Tax=Streptacidiphilus jiangxiensis TaxID=235985 RepID=A0A1H7H8E4_STRJI|nr:MrpF/PhaF family protein [Streptacidiphilus jiangxiensis]SEK46554.1 Multisubunit Na+/H+ antiporter, MnhF subunit [Streptacidiphilus jiangxiensis]